MKEDNYQNGKATKPVEFGDAGREFGRV